MNLRSGVVCTLGAASLTAILFFGLVGQRRTGLEPGASEARARLVDALGEVRFAEGKWTGGFRYAPYRHEPRKAKNDKDFRALAQEIVGAARESDPRSLADLAVLEALKGDVRQSVERLERAAELAPEDPFILSDLSAAYLARAEREDRALDLVRAFSAAEKALRRKPRLREATFNRALALQKLSLARAAESSWRAYLAVDPEGPWAAEVASRLRPDGRVPGEGAWKEAKARLKKAALEGDVAAVREVVDKFRWPSRKLGEELVGAWAAAHLRKSDRLASSLLAVSRSIAQTLADQSSDHFLLETVQAVDRSPQPELLAEGHVGYKRGSRLYGASDYQGAAREWEAARQIFARAGSPFALRAEFQLGCAESYQSRYPAALARFTAVADQARHRSFSSLLGDSLWMQGVARFSSGDLSRVPEAYRASLAAFLRVGEVESAATVQSLLAEALDYMGQPEEAWRQRREALHHIREMVDPGRRYIIEAVSGIASLKLGEPQLALLFQEETVREAEGMRNPVALAAALFWRARYFLHAGAKDLAARDLEAAQRHAALIQKGSARDRALADVLLGQAELGADHSPDQTIPLLSEALLKAKSSKYVYNLVETLLARARAFREKGDSDRAEADFEGGIRAVEDWRARLAEPAQRVSFLTAARAVFDEMVLLQLTMGRAERALDYVERGRARTLLEMFLDRSSSSMLQGVRPLPAKELFAGLPDNAVLITYTFVGGRLVIWVATRRGLEAMEVRQDSARIIGLISRFNRNLRRSDPVKLQEVATELYRELLLPIERFVPPGALLVVSCDGPLLNLPFAALFNPTTRHYLIQDHPIVMTPSGSLYVASLRHHRGLHRPGAPLRAFIIANSLAPGLPELTKARDESERVGSVYGKPEIVQGSLATKQVFLHEAPSHDVVHVIAHGLVVPGAPLWSRLILAPGGEGQDGSLYASEIAKLRFGRTSLLVLSGCNTTENGTASDDGVESLALAALAAGAPTVLGSLWKIDDEITADFMADFHRRFRATGDAPGALRSAQLELLGSAEARRRRPAIWAAFQLFGGAAPNVGKRRQP